MSAATAVALAEKRRAEAHAAFRVALREYVEADAELVEARLALHPTPDTHRKASK